MRRLEPHRLALRVLPMALAALFVLSTAGCTPGDSASESPDGRADAARGGTAASPSEVAGARGGFVHTEDGQRIHYLEVGPTSAAGAGGSREGDPGAARGAERPSLLFIPGWTLAAEIWEPQIEHFGRTHRVIAMDPRAQGRSSKARDGLHAAARAQDIREVVEALDLEPVVLIGWSMAVAEVVAYVDQFGTEGVAALVLVDGLPGLDFEPPLARAFMDWAAAFVHDRRNMTETFVRGMYRTPQPEPYLEAVIRQSLQTPSDAAVALVVGQPRSDFREALPSVDRPTLVAAAPGGPWTDLYGTMTEAIPGARLEWFEGAGHALFVDQAERFNDVLEEFLAEVEAHRAP